MNEQEKFEQEYKKSVQREADFIFKDLQATAEKKNYETDIFIRHILNELNKLNNQ